MGVSEVVLLLSADINIQRAYEWFDAHDEGRADRFLAELDRLLGLLATFPELGPVVYATRRRLLMREFKLWHFLHDYRRAGHCLQRAGLTPRPGMVARAIRGVAHRNWQETGGNCGPATASRGAGVIPNLFTFRKAELSALCCSRVTGTDLFLKKLWTISGCFPMFRAQFHPANVREVIGGHLLR